MPASNDGLRWRTKVTMCNNRYCVVVNILL